MEVIIAPKARSDIASILAWTEENFGPQTLKRYAKLIATAIEQIAEDPERAGSSQRPEIAEQLPNLSSLFQPHVCRTGWRSDSPTSAFPSVPRHRIQHLGDRTGPA